MATSEHFTDSELRCSHCGENFFDAGFLVSLELLRVAYNKPMVPTSGCRCGIFNVQVSSTGPHGPHTTGRAIDFRVARGEAFAVLELAIKLNLGVTGLGFQQKGGGRFLHLDNLTEADGHFPRPTIWSY